MDYKLDFEQRKAAGVLAEEMSCADDIEAYAFEIFALRARVAELEILLASLADLVNTLARESGTAEVERYTEPHLVRDAVEAVVYKERSLGTALRQQNATLAATVVTLREGLEMIASSPWLEAAAIARAALAGQAKEASHD